MTNLTIILFGWFIAGLLGGVHCLGMCGGLSAALGLHTSQARYGHLTLLFTANLGRIASYTLVGALLGGLSNILLWLPQVAHLQSALYLLSLLTIIFLGLYLAGISRWITILEKIGTPIWRKLSPLFMRLVPLHSIKSALIAGALWGWLPCGLVYSAGIGALASGSAWYGALIMLAFGLGTLPNLMMMGIAAVRLNRLRSNPYLRLLLGGSLSLYGLIALSRYFMLA